jgi:hypothetical protein
MSLYNMINGVNPATFFILPMLGEHPDAYPRFRDCFLKDESRPEYGNYIHVYTRTGGGNREEYEDANETMCLHPEYVTDFDDDFDSTYATWVFKVPEKWVADFGKITSGNMKDISPEYKAELYRIYPKLTEKLNEIFSASTEQKA